MVASATASCPSMTTVVAHRPVRDLEESFDVAGVAGALGIVIRFSSVFALWVDMQLGKWLGSLVPQEKQMLLAFRRSISSCERRPAELKVDGFVTAVASVEVVVVVVVRDVEAAVVFRGGAAVFSACFRSRIRVQWQLSNKRT